MAHKRHLSIAQKKNYAERGVPVACLQALDRGRAKMNALRSLYGRCDMTLESRLRAGQNSRVGGRLFKESLSQEERRQFNKKITCGLSRANAERHRRGRFDMTPSNWDSVREKVKRQWDNAEYAQRMSSLASQRMKMLWADPRFREHAKDLLIRSRIRPTCYEKKIISLCEKHDLPLTYVGDGQLFIGYRNPDFVASDGRRLVVETYAIHCHPDDYEAKRDAMFRKFGYKTLFLNDCDLQRRNWESICLPKIKGFLEQLPNQQFREDFPIELEELQCHLS